MAWCEEHECPDSICGEHRHGPRTAADRPCRACGKPIGNDHQAQQLGACSGSCASASIEPPSESRELRLARAGALTFVPVALMTDEIHNEIDDWSELGFVVMDCGCMWSIGDIDAVMDHVCGPMPS